MPHTADILLHIGAPKCGSSAIQTYLTSHPLGQLVGAGTRAGMPYTYCVIRKGELIVGEDVGRLRNANYWRYLVSSPAIELAELSDADVQVIGDQLREIVTAGRAPIISNEGYIHAPEQVGAFLERCGLRADVFAVVRPQPQYVNAAWWQWGLWMDISFEEFVSSSLGAVRWGDWLTRWQGLTSVASVQGKLLGPGVTSQLVYSSSEEAFRIRNRSLPEVALRCLNSLDRRRGVHESQFDFVIERWATFDEYDRTPWVLPSGITQWILSECAADNGALMNFLSVPDVIALSEDPCWWEGDHYGDQSIEPHPLASREDLRRMCEILIEALLAADRGVPPTTP